MPFRTGGFRACSYSRAPPELYGHCFSYYQLLSANAPKRPTPTYCTGRRGDPSCIGFSGLCPHQPFRVTGKPPLHYSGFSPPRHVYRGHHAITYISSGWSTPRQATTGLRICAFCPSYTASRPPSPRDSTTRFRLSDTHPFVLTTEMSIPRYLGSLLRRLSQQAAVIQLLRLVAW